MNKQTAEIGKGKPGPGRPKGSVNKTTALLKDAILKAAQLAGGGDDGLVEYLQKQASENPGPFMALLGKVLPMQIAGDEENPVNILHKIERVIVNDTNKNG
jgi:hypothetical protein